MNVLKKVNPPNYKEIIDKKFKHANQAEISNQTSGEKNLNKTSKELKTE